MVHVYFAELLNIRAFKGIYFEQGQTLVLV